VRKEMTEKLARLKDTPLPDPVKPDDVVQFAFDESDFTAIRQYLRGLGGLRTCCVGDINSNSTFGRLNIVANGDGLTECIVGRPTIVTMTARDAAGGAIDVNPITFLCRLTRVYSTGT